MPAFAGIIFAVAWLVLAASACSLRTRTSNCVPGSEQCTCRDGACDDGLSCVSGMCFDIGELGSKESSSTREPQANQGTRRQGQSLDAQRSSGGATSQRSDAGPSAGKAGAGGRAADAGPVRDAAADSSMAEAAGGDSAACAAPGTSCASMICCQGTSCINNTCRILCLGNTDCTSRCCMPFDATRSVCAEREQCGAAPAGQGGSSGAAGTAGRGGSGRGGSDGGAANSCSAAGAECGAQGCCDGVACVNNVCAAACSSEQECASACCLSFFAGAEKVCVPSTLCRRQ